MKQISLWSVFHIPGRAVGRAPKPLGILEESDRFREAAPPLSHEPAGEGYARSLEGARGGVRGGARAERLNFYAVAKE